MPRRLKQTKQARAARARYKKNKGKKAKGKKKQPKRRRRQKGSGFFEDVGSFITQNVLPVLPTLLPMLL